MKKDSLKLKIVRALVALLPLFIVRFLVDFLRYTPFMPLIRFKTELYRRLVGKMGHNCTIKGQLQKPENIYLGDNVRLGERSVLSTHEAKIRVGDYTIMGTDVTVVSQTHVYDRTDVPIIKQGVRCEDITIGKDCWIGNGCAILCGVTIGDGTVVGAGAVVTKDLKPYSVYGGIPAKLIKKRLSKKSNRKG